MSFLTLLLIAAGTFVLGVLSAFGIQVSNFRNFAAMDEQKFGRRFMVLMLCGAVSFVGLVGGVLVIVLKCFGYLQ